MRRRFSGLGTATALAALVSLGMSAELPQQVFYRAADGETYGPFPATSIEAWFREGYFPASTPIAATEAGPFLPIGACLLQDAEVAPKAELEDADAVEEFSVVDDAEYSWSDEGNQDAHFDVAPRSFEEAYPKRSLWK